MKPGTLFLIPVPLGDVAPARDLPESTLARLRDLRRFIAENAKSARAVLKAAQHPVALRELPIDELSEHTPAAALPELLAPLLAGTDVGLLSEAGCPAVADPGSGLVDLAHHAGIRVVPLVGPSSLLLALMASGLNGQRFSFHGYLPAKEPARSNTLRQLEKESHKNGGVQIFIETPYRNDALFDCLLATCSPRSRLCLASDLTLASEFVRTASIGEWKNDRPPSLDRRPTVFLLQAA